MHVEKSLDHLGSEDFDFRLLKSDFLVEDGEQIALGGVLQQEVESVLGLDGFVELQNVFVLQGAENRLFDEDLLNAFFGLELPLFDHFEGKQSSFQVRDEVHFAEEPRAELLQEAELVEDFLFASEFLVREVLEANGLYGFSEFLGQFLFVLLQQLVGVVPRLLRVVTAHYSR